jgi:hypothetical protein
MSRARRGLMLSPIIAALAMPVSSVSVIGNALRPRAPLVTDRSRCKARLLFAPIRNG